MEALYYSKPFPGEIVRGYSEQETRLAGRGEPCVRPFLVLIEDYRFKIEDWGGFEDGALIVFVVTMY